MHSPSRVALACGCALLFAIPACGNEVTVGATSGVGAGGATASSAGAGPAVTSTSTATTSATATGSGAGGASGECTDDADCAGTSCIAIVPGGYRVCAKVPAEASACDPSHADDQCCTSADCEKLGGGRCYLNSDFPFCGGALPPQQNICAQDLCTKDSDCFGGPTGEAACVAAGITGFPMASCLMTFCRKDADCIAAPGGFCAPVVDPCCGLIAGLACIYPDGCRSNFDCETGGCVLDTSKGIGRCDANAPQCPP